MSSSRHSRPKGTRDFVPPASDELRRVEYVAGRLSTRFGFREIVTPVFEHTEVFVKSSGDASDIVTKEMYSFQDRGKRDLTLRPEGTPGVVRAVLENKLRVPARLYYLGPYFRYGRPQKGRFREFRQYGVEAIGEASPYVDAEIVLLGDEFFRALGISDCTTELNSIGCRKCRPEYRKELVAFLSAHKNELCRECRERMGRNPLRVFDCKNEQCREVMAEAPKTSGHLCDDCGAHYDEVKKALDQMNVCYEINDRLVRGLDYYNRTVFEYISGRLGAQDSLGGGGRYDYLVEDLGGPPTPSSGFALGIDRTMMAMPEKPAQPEGTLPPRESLAYVIWMGEEELEHAVGLAARLRAEGVATRVDYDAAKPKRQFKSADAAGAACCVIVGPDELAKGVYSLKNLATGEQEEIPVNMIVPRVRALFR